MRPLPILFGLVICSTALAEEPATTIQLGGPRRAIAWISDMPSEFIVSVEMLAIRCFDNGMNERLSEDKAEQYAHEALAQYLFPKANSRVTFILSGVTVEKATLEGKHFRLTLRVPRKGVSQKEVAEKPEKNSNDAASGPAEEASPGKTKEKRSSKINLFELKGDYAETERLLFYKLKTAIPSLAEKPNDDQRKVFFTAIADLEGQAERSFDVLVAEMRKDKLLLTIEANELVKQVEKDRADVMDLLKKSVEAAAPAPSNK